MAGTAGDGISVREVLQDALIVKYGRQKLDEDLLRWQLRDQKLLKLDLDELADMDMEEMISVALTRGIEAQNDMLAERKEVKSVPIVVTETSEAEKSAEGKQETSDAPEEEIPRVRILVEGMAVEAKIILTRPQEGQPPPTEREIRDALAAHKVVRGIRFDYLTRLAERPIYDRKFKIATGKLPEDGENGTAIFHFSTKDDLSPRILADGTADYKSLDYAKSVKANELLCELVPPTAGVNGFSVLGDVLPAKMGRPAEIKNGSNTTVSPDGCKIYSACDGQVSIRNNKVQVSRLLLVDQVDASTGNILFVGTVQVAGDVSGGFTIRAGGDIMVKGIVDDAVLVAGGNIVLAGGIKGRETGRLDAGGDIRAFYIESARVRARKSIYADALLNSVIECGQMVNLSGGRGCLVGGRCTAGTSVTAVQIGNEANIVTRVVLKDIESFAEHQAKAQIKLVQYRKTLDQLTQAVDLICGDTPEDFINQIVLGRLVVTKHRLLSEIDNLQKELNEGRNMDYVRRVTARETLHANTLIEIDGALLRNQESRNNCVAVKAKGRVELRPASLY